jgi:hypothetical protein
MGEIGRARVNNQFAWRIVSENLVHAYNWLFAQIRHRRASSVAWDAKLHFYYTIRPALPRPVQIALRRMFVRWRLRFVQDIWPIDPSSSSRPQGWAGWPSGRKFAFVLTHDVESERGVARCSRLARLEKDLGLTSSFNFIPERYAQTSRIRGELLEKGFEIGVHDLWHDGKLYRSRKVFSERALRINRYLKDWGAVGFRSASMQHNLEWIHDLNIEYDCSTFDTDPFEPQPDGVGTIFPMLVRGQPGRGQYVELPYTLPQDMTVFILIGHGSSQIWKEKLDWVASHGGMALLNTHPDYMYWNGQKGRIDEYPIEFYREFLDYVIEKYHGQYWNALPRDVARYWASRMTSRQDDHQ